MKIKKSRSLFRLYIFVFLVSISFSLTGTSVLRPTNAKTTTNHNPILFLAGHDRLGSDFNTMKNRF